MDIEAGVEDDADEGRYRRGKADHGQAGVGAAAHEIGHRQADAEGLYKALGHDPDRLVVAIEIADHAEEHGRKDGLGREAFKILEALLDDIGIGREYPGQQVAAEHYEGKDGNTEGNAAPPGPGRWPGPRRRRPFQDRPPAGGRRRY